MKGRLDLSDVGLMGHSRGGEGVVRAALLNAERPDPYGIRAVMPLAPVDFAGRRCPARRWPSSCRTATATSPTSRASTSTTTPDTPRRTTSCARHCSSWARTTTSSTPSGRPGCPRAPSNDDWGVDDDPVCGSSSPQRLTAAEQRAVGAAYVSGFFRLNLGGEEQFRPLFDGTGGRAASAGRAVVHTEAQQPSSARTDLARLEGPSSSVTLASKSAFCVGAGEPVPGQAARCTSQDPYSGSLPHWTPAAFAPTVPATPLLHARWTVGQRKPVTVRVAPGAAAGVHQALTFRAAPARTLSTDLQVTLTDAKGRTASVPVSRYSTALTALPVLASPWSQDGQGAAKTWLRTVRIPLDAFPGVDLGTLASVSFTPLKPTANVFLSDVALDTPATGTGVVTTLPAVSIGDVQAVEADGTQELRMPLTLSHRSAVPVTVDVDTAAAALDGRIPAAWTRVTIPAGALTGSAVVPLTGDTVPEEQQARFTVTIATPRGAVVGDGFGTLTVFDDDAFGPQG